MIAAITHGFLLALGLILPLGVQNVFVFNQGALQKHYYKALPVVITASLCDTALILLAITGVSVIVLQFAWLKTMLLIFGIAFLLYMGWVSWKSIPSPVKHDDFSPLSAKKQVMFAMSVSLLNPHAILDTVGVIGTSSLQYSGVEKVIFTIACITVSWCWFASLAFAGKMTSRLDQSGKTLYILNKVSALFMWGMAVYMAFSLVN
ncbi:LysE/ArgO family amino acid transporter [Bacillus songklensis]|uniref:LysE/ArgO family amino acid transporter n=1 Tax=Bacillus songklensis TaxID=1069116 RepID=A0ABV8AWS4_9BACI